MNVILCNDDGIYSNGLTQMAEVLVKNGHNVLIVAPDGNRSGASHSLTFFRNITVKEVFDIKGCKAFAISGTPVDCIKFAQLNFPEFKPDVVIAGINKGHNLGSDTLYSGTLGIACEASFFGDISFAFSAFNLDQNDFLTIAEYALKIINDLLKISTCGDIWNINFPDCSASDIKGVKITKLGKQIYSDRYINMGNNEYQLVGERLFHDQNDQDCDVVWVEKGYVSITPILFNKTDYDKMRELKEICIEL